MEGGSVLMEKSFLLFLASLTSILFCIIPAIFASDFCSLSISIQEPIEKHFSHGSVFDVITEESDLYMP
jgi:hypothetical protein